jgi:hypothetical protein
VKNPFLLFILFCVSESALAHPGPHDHYGFAEFIHHFFTQPDHLAIMAVILTCLVLSQTVFRGVVSRLLQRRWFN